MRKSCRAAFAIAALAAGCTSVKPATTIQPAEPVSTDIAVATFDSLWSKVHSTYVDTAFVAREWVQVRDSLRPRAQRVTTRAELDKLLNDALHHIHDSHFYLIPARIATTRSESTSGGGKGSTGLAVRVAEGKVVAWRVEEASPAWNAGLRPGQVISAIEGKKTDSAIKHVLAMPAQAQPLELANMLHGFNGMLNPAVDDTVDLTIEPSKRLRLAAVQGEGKLSQF
jgi:C-terminal processing protease CtpA/Prc